MTYPGPPSPDPTPGSGPPNYPPPPLGPLPPGYGPPPGDGTPPAGFGSPPPGYGPPGYGPPGYGPPGYGPPGYPPVPYPYGTAYPPPRRRRRWPWIVAAVVGTIVVVLVVVGVLVGRTGSDDPHTAVNRFWTALVQHDIGKAQKYWCPSQKLKSNAAVQQFVSEVSGYQIGAESGSGNTRVYPVTVEVTIGGLPGNATADTTAKKSGGKWYVCGVSVR